MFLTQTQLADNLGCKIITTIMMIKVYFLEYILKKITILRNRKKL